MPSPPTPNLAGGAAVTADQPVPSSSIESGRTPDPHGFGPYANSLSAATQKRVKAAVVAAAMALDDGEQVHGMVCGEYLGHDGVAVLTNNRVLCVNARTFAPDQDSIMLADLDDVGGWIESNRATLQISGASEVLVIGNIKEVDVAQKLASDLRVNL